MRILLDTHLLLWWLEDDPRLPAAAEAFITDSGNIVFVSAASIWEIAIKAALGRLEADPMAIEAVLEPSGFEALPVTTKHAAEVSKLPLYHRDPFDRILVAQSLVEPMRLLTHDQALAQYGSMVLLV
jgi:PIN domain nuclease of toxin-antitoxin system